MGQTFYHRGDKAKYTTGKPEFIHGGNFYEAVYIEGHRKGTVFLTQRAPEVVS